MKGSRRGPRDPGAGRRAGLGAIAGLLAAATALGVGQLVAGLTGANGSPVVAVGQLQIDFTPPWLKNFAINEFGSDDKLALVSGILVVLAIFAAGIGVAATRRLAYGMTGLVVFAAIGLTAAATRPTATASSLLPTLAATAAAAIVLRVLIERAVRVDGAGPEAWRDSAEVGWTSPPRTLSGPEPSAEDGSGPDAADGSSFPGLPAIPDLPPGMGQTGSTGGVVRPSSAQGRDWLAGTPRPSAGTARPSAPVEPARRSFLAASAVTAGIAATAGLAGRLLAERTSVASARTALKIPRPSAAGPEACSGACLDSAITTSAASAIPARRRPSLAGLSGRCSWNSQVPAMMKYMLPVTPDTGTTIDARPACSAAWKSSIATAEEPASTYRYGDETTPIARPASVWWRTRMPESPLIATTMPYARGSDPG